VNLLVTERSLGAAALHSLLVESFDCVRERKPGVLALAPRSERGSREVRVGETTDGNCHHARYHRTVPKNGAAAVGAELLLDRPSLLRFADERAMRSNDTRHIGYLEKNG
jgi:hypothetical protein